MLTLSADLYAAHLGADDVGDHKVTEPGWYALDDHETAVLGPFGSLGECERAIQDRKHPPAAAELSVMRSQLPGPRSIE
jgi:hypothetical protein